MLSDDRAGRNWAMPTSVRLRGGVVSRLAVLLFAVSLACSVGEAGAVLELSIRKQSGAAVTPTDVVRLERRMLRVRGVTLVSLSASRDALLIHHGAATDMGQIEAALRDTGFQWVRTAD